jgi:hypothetical protein
MNVLMRMSDEEHPEVVAVAHPRHDPGGHEERDDVREPGEEEPHPHAAHRLRSGPHAGDPKEMDCQGFEPPCK